MRGIVEPFASERRERAQSRRKQVDWLRILEEVSSVRGGEERRGVELRTR